MHRNISLRGVRFNWLSVLVPKQFSAGDLHRFQAEVLVEPDSDAAEVLAEALLSASEEKWPGKGEGMIAVAESNKKCCRKSGDTMPLDKKTMEIPEHYLGNIVLSASRVQERDGDPKVYSQRKSNGKLLEVTKDTKFDDDLIKPVRGNYGDVMVSIWGWEHKGSPQLNCTLEAIAFRGEGDSFSTHAAVTTEDVGAAFDAEIEETANPFGG